MVFVFIDLYHSEAGMLDQLTQAYKRNITSN